MNLDDLKTAWKEYDQKLRSTQMINERIITSMISERTGNRFERIARLYRASFTWMLICLAFGILVLFTNPFDYGTTLQYIPMVIFVVCLAALIVGMTWRYMALRKISFSHQNIEEALRSIIAEYQKPRKFVRYTVILFFFSQVFLFPLSFLPRNIETIGFWSAIRHALIPMTTAAVLLYLANRLGAFKERHVETFTKDLTELESLKAMSAELMQDN